MRPMGTLVNDSLDKLVHWFQVGDALQSQGLKLIRAKDIKESYEEGRSTYTKIRIRRQNYDYMKQNMLTISQCVNYAVKWFGV